MEKPSIIKKPFSELNTATMTIMTHTNIIFNHKAIFSSLPIYYKTIGKCATTKKKSLTNGNVPYGNVIGIRYGIFVRGFWTVKNKKYWCPNCQLFDTEKDKEILTVKQSMGPCLSLDECKDFGFPEGTAKIIFQCNKCEKYIDPDELNKLTQFPNQLSLNLSVNPLNINIMLFENCCTVSGCKKDDEAIESIMILWETYLSGESPKGIEPIPKGIEPILGKKWSFNPKFPSKDVHFIFESRVMRNVDFDIGFPIDKIALKTFLNNAAYKTYISISAFESTSNTHVNTKMFSPKPEGYMYPMLIYPESEEAILSKTVNRLYASKAVKASYEMTFMSFSSSKNILSGRYDEVMETRYNFFIDLFEKHRDEICEVIVAPKMSLQDFLKKC